MNNCTRTILFSAMALTIACNTSKHNKNGTVAQQLIETWKLIQYEDYDTLTGKTTRLYGDHPKGYFTYTKSGIVNINGSAENTLPISEDSAYKSPISIGLLLDNAWGYFGTYSVDVKNAVVTHYPTGGSIPWYIGTEQHRQFILKGDTLFIGDPTFKIGKRVLIRVE